MSAIASSTIDATTYKFSALYDPLEWLRFRGTHSRDIRAPNFSELYERTESVGFAGITNPWTNQSDIPLVANTGNVDVDAEQGDTTTAGIVFSPTWDWGQGFRFSVDWWEIEIHGAIDRLGTTAIVTQCFQGNQTVCGFLDTPGAQITNIRNSYLNLSVYATKGIDFEADYQIDLDGGANLGLRLFATKTEEIKAVIAGVTTDFTGVTGPQLPSFGQPEWALNGTVSYDRGPWGVSLQARYIDSGLYNSTWIEPTDPRYSLTNPAVRPFTVNDNTIDSVVYANLSGRYQLPMKNDRTWELFATVNNLFDEDPPLAPDGAYPTNAAFFDQIGRSLRLGIRADF